MSLLGVTTAATMKMISTAYLKCLSRNPADTMPNRDSTNTSSGIWKTRPRPSIILT